MKLEEAICLYLPHKVNIKTSDGKGLLYGVTKEYISILEAGGSIGMWDISEIKLVLRPMSDITKEIEHEGERFVPAIKIAQLVDNRHNHEISKIKTYSGSVKIYDERPGGITDVVIQFDRGKILSIHSTLYGNTFYSTCERVKTLLLKYHFDVFGLIEKEQAVNYNEVI
ncbi:MAG: hypothetical protein OEW87_10040 [Flavobacteriaceae bacterium]|nr:hypothetical protein [Flavobacteriaceae bacterium]